MYNKVIIYIILALTIISCNQDNSDNQGEPEAKKPALAIQNFSTTKSEIAVSQTFRLKARIINNGNAESSPTRIKYYQSTDETIDSTDKEIGDLFLEIVAVNRATDKELEVTSVSIGNLYYGACIMPSGQENDLDNNCSSTILVIVTEIKKPDLAIQNFSTPKSEVAIGESFSLKAMIINNGNAESNPTRIKYYQSSANTSNREIGDLFLEVLAANSTTDKEFDVTVDSIGNFRYWSCILTNIQESNNHNNCSRFIFVKVSNLDLAITSFTANDTRPNLSQVVTFKTNISSSNITSSDNTIIRYYQSTDATNIANEIANVGVTITSDAIINRNVNITAPAIPGNYYYKACVGAISFEINLANNCSFPALALRVGQLNLGDPLYAEQWYLKNTGQTGYSDSNGVIGADINVSEVLQTGRGVLINIVDADMEIAHEDLAPNVIPGSVNFDGGSDPTLSYKGRGHGTVVAGIAASAANNRLGGRGVAPEASLIAYNYLSNPRIANDIKAILATADINNQSYVIRNTYYDRRIYHLIEDAYKEGITSGREGKGKIYVKSAGNSFISNKYPTHIDSCKFINSDNNQLSINTYFTTNIVSCENANFGPRNTSPYNLVVGAIDKKEIKAFYSTAGSALFISSPGGGSGGLITTDRSGCDNGYTLSHNTDFNKGRIIDGITNERVNPSCNYINSFRGTSAAAPVVTGVIALMLEANPNLSWRDVRYILAHTARKIDGDRNVVKTRNDRSEVIADATAELGWVRNSAGLNFHNWYGFGLIDASAAVKMSLTYNSNLGVFQELEVTNDTDISIPDKSVIGAKSTISFTNNLKIETIQIDLQVRHTRTSDLGIWLRSPSGTESLLINPFNNFSGVTDSNMQVDNQNLDFILASHTFYGEQAQGEWELKIIDYREGQTGLLQGWKLIVFGH